MHATNSGGSGNFDFAGSTEEESNADIAELNREILQELYGVEAEVDLDNGMPTNHTMFNILITLI